MVELIYFDFSQEDGLLINYEPEVMKSFENERVVYEDHVMNLEVRMNDPNLKGSTSCFS